MSLLCTSVFSMEKINLQLQWTNSFQFAGYYMAKEKGYFKEVGLDVDFIEAGSGIDPVAEVVSGKAQYGVGTSSLMISRANGLPVVAIGVIFQTSPQILIGNTKLVKNNFSKFKNEKILLEPNNEELLSLLRQEKFPMENILNAKGDSLDKFLKEEVGMIVGYSTSEPYFIQKAQIPYKVFHPRNYGLDFYGDNVFTTEEELKSHPDRVNNFMAAIKKGWAYALKNKQETISVILSKYAQKSEEEQLHFEASEIDIIVKNEFVPIGFMNKEKWENISQIYKENNLIPKDFNVNDFLYFNKDNKKEKELQLYLGVISALLFLAIINMGYVIRLNKKLSESNKQLNHMAGHDILTGLPNRVLFSSHMKKGIALAKRNYKSAAVIFIDINKFKQINDMNGHAIGDLILKEVAQRILLSIREVDTACRIGGDEFVIFLTNLNQKEDAIKVVQKITKKMNEPFVVDEKILAISLSMGVAIYPEHSLSEEKLMKFADTAMYRAKYNGEGNIVTYEDGMSIG